jgi:hypothetical protein
MGEKSPASRSLKKELEQMASSSSHNQRTHEASRTAQPWRAEGSGGHHNPSPPEVGTAFQPNDLFKHWAGKQAVNVLPQEAEKEDGNGESVAEESSDLNLWNIGQLSLWVPETAKLPSKTLPAVVETTAQPATDVESSLQLSSSDDEAVNNGLTTGGNDEVNGNASNGDTNGNANGDSKTLHHLLALSMPKDAVWFADNSETEAKDYSDEDYSLPNFLR